MSIFLTLLVACSSTVGPQENGSANIGGQDALPIDLQQISNRPFDQVVEDGWGITGEGDPYRNISIEADPAATDRRQSPPNTLEITYPKGFKGGSAPHNRTWKMVRDQEWSEILVSVWVKYSQNFTGHTPTGVNKLIFVTQDGFAGSPLFLLAKGTGKESLVLQVNTQDSRFPNRHFKSNRSRGELTRGRWHRIDLYARMNSGDRLDGELRFWLDGDLVGEYYDAQFSMPSDPRIWSAVKLDAIWGGTGGVVPEEQTLRIDDLVIRGRR